MSYDIDSLITSHMKLAETIALKEWRTATHILKRDDMLSLAYFGLVDAAHRWEPYCKEHDYDPAAVNYFKVFAGLRIRGTIRDYIRKDDWATRTLRSKAKLLKQAGQDEGLSVQELAEKTGMSIAEIHKVNAKLSARPVSLDARIGLKEYDAETTEVQLKEDIDTEGIAFANSMIETFVATIKKLPYETQLIIVLHYYAKLDLCKVAEELGFSESKVSQLHSSGVLTVKQALTTAAMERG